MKHTHLTLNILLMAFLLAPLFAFSQDQADTLAEGADEVAGTLKEPPIDGKPLFKSLCASCHHPTQRLVGPPLQGVREKRDSAWLINFVKSSQSMIEEGDSLAQALFMEYNQVPMPDHPQLTVEQINAILDYASSPEDEVAAADQPISRPEMPARTQYKPLSFTSFTFWLIYTATVFMIIGWLYYMIEYTEIVKQATGEKEGDADVPFGEQ